MENQLNLFKIVGASVNECLCITNVHNCSMMEALL